MYKHLASFKDFVYTQYFYDGIKITIGVLMPSLLFFQFDNLLMGLPLSLGALCVSVADNPGSNLHKRNAMALTALFIFLVTLLTSLFNKNVYLLGVEIFVLSFVFSMFHIYGDRAAAIGTATLLIMIFNIDQIRPYNQVLQHGLYVLAGGVWYMLLSLLFVQIRPYSYAQQSLGECVQEIAKYLNLKSEFYSHTITVNEVFKKLVNQQVIINEQQENVREVLYKTGRLQNQSSPINRLLIVIFIDMVDIFEQTMVSHYDYDVVRNNYEKYNILGHFKETINKLAAEINYLGLCLTHNNKPGRHLLTLTDLDILKKKLDILEAQGVSVLLLKKILINIKNIFNRVDDIYKYYENPKQNYIDKDREVNFGKFINPQNYNLSLLKSNFTLESSNFRHAMRVSLVMLLGYLVANLLPVGHHSYWILLTILVILKPGFSLSKQRNYERVIGTLIGGIAGVLILMFVKDLTIRFSFLLVFMVLTYSFQRLKYVVSVLFMTPFVLILFTFISPENNLNVASERVIDTLIGSVIAFLASYLLFPSWESFNFKMVLCNMLKANLAYYEVIVTKLSGKTTNPTLYKLVRKQVYVKTANLGAAFKRMLNEPKNKQHKTIEVQKFVVLNHILTSYLANLSVSLNTYEISLSIEEVKAINKSVFYLKEAVLLIDKKYLQQTQSLTLKSFGPQNSSLKNQLQIEQLNQILKIATDIFKITEKM